MLFNIIVDIYAGHHDRTHEGYGLIEGAIPHIVDVGLFILQYVDALLG
jgi:hypothetical protein